MQKRKKHYTNQRAFLSNKWGFHVFILYHNFWIHKSLDPLSNSKWLSKPQFYQSHLCIWRKIIKIGLKTAIYQLQIFNFGYQSLPWLSSRFSQIITHPLFSFILKIWKVQIWLHTFVRLLQKENEMLQKCKHV